LGHGRMCYRHDTIRIRSGKSSYIQLFWCNADGLQGVFGGVIVTQDYLDTMNLNGPTKTALLGTVTAIYDVGCAFGAIFAVMIGDPLGRKKSVLLGTSIMTVGAILQITAYGVPQMIVGRSAKTYGPGIFVLTYRIVLSLALAMASTPRPRQSGRVRHQKRPGEASSSSLK